MTLQRFTWMLRCSECGWTATGYGKMPAYAEFWVCGVCAELKPVDHVVQDKRLHGSACHFDV